MLKRIVGDQWKKALAVEVAGAPTLRPLSKTDTAKLDKLLRNNVDLAAEFENFSQPLDLVLNLSFALPKKSDFPGFKTEFEKAFAQPLENGLTSDAILKVIANSKYAAHFNDIPRNATLQFACQDLEVKRKQFVYRSLQVHNF
jgi:hypothetical protein